MSLVLGTGDAALLPEVGQLVEERPAGTQVQDVLPGERVVQEWVVHMGEQPGQRREGRDVLERGLSNRGQERVTKTSSVPHCSRNLSSI